MLKQQKGITLVALVITIVVLIILAGVAISLTLSDNGIFNKAKEGRDQYKTSANEESRTLTNAEAYVNSLVID